MNFADTIENILRSDATLTDDQRADLFDVAHQAASHEEFAQSLEPLSLSATTKNALVRAKFDSQPLVVRAIAVLNSFDPAVLHLAESHPTVFRALVAEHSGKKS